MADEQYDLDALNSTFADLRSVASGHVTPPGIAAARATATRRRHVRLATLAAVVVALAIIPVATFAKPSPDVAQPTPEVIVPTASPSMESPSASPSPTPTPPPTQAASATSSGSGSGYNFNQPLAYTAIWYTGPLDGVRVELPKSHSFSVPIGIKVWSRNSTKVGPVTNAKLAIDLSQITSKVEPVSVSGPCSLSGSNVLCDFGTLATGNHLASLTLRARPGASAGEVGQVNLTASGNEQSWHTKLSHGKVSIGSFEEATDYTVKTSIGSGRVGDNVTMTVNVTNHGPTQNLYYEVLADSLAGADFVGMSANCQPAQLAHGCRVENIPAGGVATIEIYYRITSCAVNNYSPGLGFTYMPYDIVSYNPSSGNPQFKVTGC